MRTRDARHDMQAGAARVTSQSQQQAALPLSVLLDRWVADQIITPEQAARMAGTDEFRVYADVNEHLGRVQRSSLVVEALGYLGGAIVVAASMLIAARYWSDLASAWRLAVLGSAALTLLVCGAAAPARLADVGDRLRAVLWLGSTAACAGFLAVLAVDFLDLHGNDITLLVATGTAAYAVGLWLSSSTLVQQLAMMVALAVTASAAVAQADVSDDVPGLGTWAVGLIWALLGWGGVLKPARFGLALGSAMAIFGAMLTAASDAGTVLTLVTVIAVVGAAMAFRDLLLLAVGTLGLLMNLPMAITRWFPDSLAAPYALLVVGALLVVVAVWVARRRTPEGVAVPRQDYSSGRAGTAVAASGVVAASVVTAVLAIALL
jgi:hypothetical protein